MEVKISFQGHNWDNILIIKTKQTLFKLECNGKWKLMSQDLLNLVNKYMLSHVNQFQWGLFYNDQISQSLLDEIEGLI